MSDQGTAPIRDTKTILEWGRLLGIEVLDPDGFDRTDPDLDARVFTLAEFLTGAAESTCSWSQDGFALFSFCHRLIAQVDDLERELAEKEMEAMRFQQALERIVGDTYDEAARITARQALAAQKEPPEGEVCSCGHSTRHNRVGGCEHVSFIEQRCPCLRYWIAPEGERP